jgi:hypothetical protein
VSSPGLLFSRGQIQVDTTRDAVGTQFLLDTLARAVP